MATVETKPVTAEEYAAFPDPADGTRLELARGEVIAMPRPTWEHGEIQVNIASEIRQYLKRNPIGRVATESGVITERGPDTVRGPDVSFMSKGRMPLGERMNRFADRTPDLCVEVLSPSNTRKALDEKIGEYFATGCRMVWVIDPDERSVTVYIEPHEARLLKGNKDVNGGDVLPGFTCKVADLFA